MNRPSAAVTGKPTSRLTNKATTNFAERSASQRMTSTMANVITPFLAAFSLMVPNSSSDSATGPVRRTGRLILRRDGRGDLPQPFARGVARLQIGVVEHGADLDDSAQFIRLRWMALLQHAPGEARRAARQHVLERLSGHVQRSGELVECQFPLVEADQDILEHRDQPAQAFVGRHIL